MKHAVRCIGDTNRIVAVLRFVRLSDLEKAINKVKETNAPPRTLRTRTQNHRSGRIMSGRHVAVVWD